MALLQFIIIDTLSKVELEKLKLLVMIVKLKQRNRTLAQLLYVKSFPFFHETFDVKECIPKRGRKCESEMNTKLIQKILCCSRRKAQDYKLYFKAVSQYDTFCIEAMYACARVGDKKRREKSV